MIEITKKLKDIADNYSDIVLPEFTFKDKNVLFLDIETTGFSGKNASVYAIGCIYQEENESIFHQLFSDSISSEKELLIRLETILQSHGINLLVHFNGKTFDIPFLLKRYEKYHLGSSLSEIPQFDFYWYHKKLKSYFSLENAKLKTLEKLLKLNRKDQMDGGRLIEVYYQYLEGNEDFLPLLLLHNEEDLLATFLLLHFLPLMEKKEEKNILFPYFQAFPDFSHALDANAVSFHNEGWKQYLYAHFSQDFFSDAIHQTILRYYPIFDMELLHFFEDYKSYTYLPHEDIAIHNSVAQYVEPSFRKKATKKTAFTRKKDRFVLLPSALQPFCKDISWFQESYESKERYLLLSDFIRYLQSFDDFKLSL